MEITIITASIMWPIMLLLWIWLFINTKYYKHIWEGFKNNKWLIIITSILWMILWSYMVANHNILNSLADMIISIVWWVILLKASFMIALPTTFTKIMKNIKYTTNLLKTVWILYIIIGLYLTNFAYYWILIYAFRWVWIV